MNTNLFEWFVYVFCSFDRYFFKLCLLRFFEIVLQVLAGEILIISMLFLLLICDISFISFLEIEVLLIDDFIRLIVDVYTYCKSTGDLMFGDKD